MNMDQQPVSGVRPGAIVAGVILLAAGVAMLLDTTGITHINVGRLVAPVILIAMGSAIVLGRGSLDSCGGAVDRPLQGREMRRRGGATGGIWLIGLGIWMLVSQSHFFGLSFHTSWPLLLVFMGLIMVVRGAR